MFGIEMNGGQFFMILLCVVFLSVMAVFQIPPVKRWLSANDWDDPC